MSHDKKVFGTIMAVSAGLVILAVILIFTAISLTSEVSDYEPEDIVLANIKPVGEVYIAGESEPEAAVPAAKKAMVSPAAKTENVVEAAAPKSGKQVYSSSCSACHGTGAAGAPKMGDVAAWAPRIASGMDSLLTSATNGKNAMPPKGLCMSCSSDELKAAIEYMVSNSQ